MLNYDWLLGGEAVDAADAGEAGDASLGYSSCIWVAGWFQARFQLHPDDDDAPSSVYGMHGQPAAHATRDVFLCGPQRISGILH